MWGILLAATAALAASKGSSSKPGPRVSTGPFTLRAGQIYRIGGSLMGIDYDAEQLGVHVSVAARMFEAGLRTAGAWDIAIQPATPLPFEFTIVYPRTVTVNLPGAPPLELQFGSPRSAFPVYEWIEAKGPRLIRA